MRNDELYHYGVVGMKWGVRRYQRKDGTWTGAGKARRKKMEPRKKRLTTPEQKEKLRKIIKGAAIGAGIAGVGVGGALLAKKYGPQVLNAMKSSAKYTGDLDDLLRAGKNNYDAIDKFASLRNKVPKGSKQYDMYTKLIKNARKESIPLGISTIKKGAGKTVRKVLRLPSDIANYGITEEGQAIGKEMFKENYKKLAGIGATAAGVVGTGATMYLGAAATDKLFDENYDRRAARINQQRYVKKPMQARASEYIFPNPNRKKK